MPNPRAAIAPDGDRLSDETDGDESKLADSRQESSALPGERTGRLGEKHAGDRPRHEEPQAQEVATHLAITSVFGLMHQVKLPRPYQAKRARCR
jgi:hypothetical protein